MTTARRSLSGLTLAVALVAAVLSGCSPDPEKPKPIPPGKPLPTCADFLPVLVSLGMDRPEIEPPSRSDLRPGEVNCPFSASGARTPGMSWARVIAVRPDTEPYEGASVQDWVRTFVASYRCEGLKRPAPAMPQGTFCYRPENNNIVSVNLLGAPDNRAIWVSVHWRDPTATEIDFRATAEQKADELARQVIAML